MKQKISRNEDWCPDCGRLLHKNSWNCQVCGWSLYESQHDASMDPITGDNEHEDLFGSTYTSDLDRFMDDLDRNSRNAST